MASPKRRPAKKARRTFYELFLDKLRELSTEEQFFVSNPTLREALKCVDFGDYLYSLRVMCRLSHKEQHKWQRIWPSIQTCSTAC